VHASSDLHGVGVRMNSRYPFAPSRPVSATFSYCTDYDHHRYVDAPHSLHIRPS